MEAVFFDGWQPIIRAVVLAITAFLGLITILRISGKRTLAKMNVFDFVFVVAMGSMLAHTILTKETTLLEGLAALTILVALQVILSWLSLKSHKLEAIINGKPALMVFKGRLLHDAMHRERVTDEEIRAAIRAENIASIEAVHAVILETDGTFSVVWRNSDSPSSLHDVPGYSEANEPQAST
jgi:uncharacterized membrane protein YcaP (DUF421 family)